MRKEIHHSAPSGAVYGLGLIGSAIYFIMHATTFWAGNIYLRSFQIFRSIELS